MRKLLLPAFYLYLLLACAGKYNNCQAAVEPVSPEAGSPAYESTPIQNVLINNPIKLTVVKNAPSSDLPELTGDLTLLQAVQNGIKNNLRLKLSEQAWIDSKFLARAAISRFGPQASFNTLYSKSSLNQMLFFPGNTSVVSPPMQPIVKGNSLSLIFAATQPVFTGGKLLGGYKAARAQEKQAYASFKEEEINTALKVKESYWASVYYQAKLQVASDYVKFKEWTSNNIKSRMQEGKVPRADYLREEAELSKAKIELNESYRDFNSALLNLKVAMAVNLASTIGLKDALDYQDRAKDLSTNLLAAAKNRPEISRATNKVAEMKARKMVAMSKYSPQVNLYGLGSNISGANPDNYASGSWGGVIGIVGGVTLFDAGERLNELKAANTALKEAEIAKQDTELKVAQEVSQAWIDLDLARRNIELARDELKSAEEDYRLYQMRYQVGKAIALEQFDAAVKMFQARLAVFETVYKYKLAEARLSFASGSL